MEDDDWFNQLEIVMYYCVRIQDGQCVQSSKSCRDSLYPQLLMFTNHPFKQMTEAQAHDMLLKVEETRAGMIDATKAVIARLRQLPFDVDVSYHRQTVNKLRTYKFKLSTSNA